MSETQIVYQRCCMASTIDASNRNRNLKHKSRRGAAAVFGLVLTGSLVVVLAVTLDHGFIGISQTELRRSVDATAMAACWELYDQQLESPSGDVSLTNIRNVATSAAAQNLINQQSPQLGITGDDLAIGHYDFGGGGFSTSLVHGANAVRIKLTRQYSLNGELPLFFGAITGQNSLSLQQHAVAAMINDIKGFYAPANDLETIDILPIALDLETWLDVVAGRTPDNFHYGSGQLSSGSDGYHECNLYPQGTGSPGNRGTVDIGGRNNSTADISRQVLHGISRSDFIALGKPLELNSNGELELNGDTGISAGIKDELASNIGQKQIIPIYSSVSGNGNNAMYTIVRLEGVRILDVKLTGSKNGKRVTIQPAKMVARNAIISSTGSSSSQFLVSPVMIVE